MGIGRDRSDKNANKAQTQAYKYLLLPLLHVADRDDDAEAADTRGSIDEDRIARYETQRAADVKAYIAALDPQHRPTLKSVLALDVEATGKDVAMALHAPGGLELAQTHLQPKETP